MRGDRVELEAQLDAGAGTPFGQVQFNYSTTTGALWYQLQQLAGQGIEPERAPYTVSDGGSRLCFVRDPDDYRIELIERG